VPDEETGEGSDVECTDVAESVEGGVPGDDTEIERGIAIGQVEID
jgi:hypothetical protein